MEDTIKQKPLQSVIDDINTIEPSGLANSKVGQGTTTDRDIIEYRKLIAAILSDAEGSYDLDTLTRDEAKGLKFKTLKNLDADIARDMVRYYSWDSSRGFKIENARDRETLAKSIDLLRDIVKKNELQYSDLAVHKGRMNGLGLKALLGNIPVVQGMAKEGEIMALTEKYGKYPYDDLSRNFESVAKITEPYVKRLATARTEYQSEVEKYTKAVDTFNETMDKGVDKGRADHYFNGYLKVPGIDKVMVDYNGSSQSLKSVIEQIRRDQASGKMTLVQALNAVQDVKDKEIDKYNAEQHDEKELAPGSALKARVDTILALQTEIRNLKQSEPKDTLVGDAKKALDDAKRALDTKAEALHGALASLKEMNEKIIAESKNDQRLKYALDSAREVTIDGTKVLQVTIVSEEYAKYHYGVQVPYLTQANKDKDVLEKELKGLQSKVPADVYSILKEGMDPNTQFKFKGPNGSEWMGINQKKLDEALKKAKLDGKLAREVQDAADAIDLLYGSSKLPKEDHMVLNVIRMPLAFYETRKSLQERGKRVGPDDLVLDLGEFKQGSKFGPGKIQERQDAMGDKTSAIHEIADSWDRQFKLTTRIGRREWSYFERPFQAAKKDLSTEGALKFAKRYALGWALGRLLDPLLSGLLTRSGGGSGGGGGFDP